ncbi:MAG: cupin domain-containing protein [Pseudonocardiaceae bacterium]
MYQLLKIDHEVLPVLGGMFDELGEPIQVLTPESTRPLVVHHTMGQVTLVCRGRGHVSLDGESLPIKEGDLIIMAAGCEHSFMCTQGKLALRHWHWPRALLHADRVILVDTYDFGEATGRGTASPVPH